MVWETWLEIIFFTLHPFGLFELKKIFKNISKFMVGSGNILPESNHPSSHKVFKEAVDSGKWQMKCLFYYYLGVCPAPPGRMPAFQGTDEVRWDSQKYRPCSVGTCGHLRKRKEGSPTQDLEEEAAVPQCPHPVAGDKKGIPRTNTRVQFYKTHLILFTLFYGLLFPLNSLLGTF